MPDETRWQSHPAEACEPPCPEHAPSVHHMVEWPLVYRSGGLWERTCPEGVGHPDPDSLAFLRRHWEGRFDTEQDAAAAGVHSCDGCCARPDVGGAREVLLDLHERSGRARAHLLAMADDAKASARPVDEKRLRAKAEGVGLVRSYVEEDLRLLGEGQG